MTDHSPPGLIMLAATPVGNAGDASARLVDALAMSDVIAAEDTRRLRALLSRLDVEPQGQIVSFYEGNESARSISDPGFRLVREAHESDVDITCLPGPSAALAALVLSGLPVARFAFEGFLPRKDGDRRRRLASLATEERTMVFFEAPHRLDVSVRDMADAFGVDRRAAVCRELTKTYEEVKRDSLGELARWAEGEVRGEITIVVAGASDDERRDASGLGDDEAIAAAVRDRMDAGASRKEAAAEVADQAGLSKRYVYDVSLRTVDDT